MLAVSMTPPVAHYPVVQKRPKLSLQTSELPITYGTSSRGLSTIATPTAAVTPTTFNTFNNTYDLAHRPSPTSATASPSILRSSTQRERVSRSQSPRPKRVEQPYTVNLPYGVKPILRNTPFPRVRTNSISASPRSSTRRVFFPAPKQVVFRNVIEEEIVTKVYTACHSDLFHYDIESEREPSNEPEPETEDTAIETEQTETESSVTVSSTQGRRCRRNSVELITTAAAEPSLKPVATPSSSKSKRRKWEWTLTPLPHSQPKVEADSTSETDSGHKSESEICESESAHATIQPTEACQDPPDLTAESCPDATSKAPPHSATQPTPIETDKTSTSSSLSILVPSKSPTLPQSTKALSQQTQKRAGSLDGSPRKRKAECLDMITTTTGVTGGLNADADLNDTTVGEGSAGKKGSKRRERAATL